MRLSRSVLATAFLASGCGSETAPPGPPPPPAPSPPTAIAVQSGDGQEGAPGATLPVAPSVTVRDAAGRVVANVAVTFAVDSGGGTIAGPTATTGATGVATAGQWQLGPSEGRQVVSARAGSLVAKFVAGAVIPEVSYPQQAVSTAGGTVTLARPGLPLDGFAIRFPAGALSSPASVTLSVRSAALITLPPGVTAATPLVRINAGAASLTQPALVRVPFVAVPGAIRVVAVRNASGSLTPLPTVLSDNASITAALGDLSAPAAAAAAGALPGPAAGAAPLEVVLVSLSEALIAGDFDSNFRPGVDDWDFARQPITAVPGSGQAVVDPAESMLATSLWYFAHRKSLDGPLWQHFQEAPGIPESNRRGLRWVGVAAPSFTGFYVLSDVATTMKLDATASPVPAAAVQYKCVKILMGMFKTIPTPVPVLLFAGTSVDAPRAAIAFRTVGNVIELAIPDQPGQVFRAEYDVNGMKPFQVSTTGGGTYTVTGLATASGMNLTLESGLDAQWPSVVGKTIGSKEGWPETRLRGPDGSGTVIDLDTSDLILLTPYDHWWRCAGCANSGFVPTNIPNDDRTLLFRRATRAASGTYGALLPATFSVAQFSDADVKPALESTSGYALYQAGPGSSLGNARGQSWLDWKTVRYRRLPTTITPKTVAAPGDTTVAFTGTVDNLPTGAKFKWVLDGPNTTTSVETTTLAHTKTITDIGLSKMILTVVDGPTGRPIGTDESAITIDDHRLRWRLTGFQQTSLTATSPGGPAFVAGWESSRTMNEIRDSLIARAGGGVLEIIAAGAAHPQGFKRQDDFFVFRATVLSTGRAMFLTFPRGSELLVEAVGGLGDGLSPTLPAKYHDLKFENSFTQTGTSPITYVGKAANWVRSVEKTVTVCEAHPNGSGDIAYSPAKSYVEIDATTTPTGLNGTITFVTNVLAIEIQAVPTVCVWEPMAYVRRTFSFTAVKGP